MALVVDLHADYDVLCVGMGTLEKGTFINAWEISPNKCLLAYFCLLYILMP